MDSYLRLSEGVFVSAVPIAVVGQAEIEFVKAEAARTTKRRARLCLHRSDTAGVHEMVIALSRSTYVRPHRHAPGKSESYHVLEGEGDVLAFADDGTLVRAYALGGASGHVLCRFDETRYHTLLIRSEVLVIHETTNGPFAPGSSEPAAFAPDEQDAAAVSYLAELRVRAAGLHADSGGAR